MKIAGNKSVPIKAIQFDGNNFDEIYDFMGIDINKRRNILCNYLVEVCLLKKVGDYIIKGENGRFFTCNSDTFNNHYDRICDLDEKAKGIQYSTISIDEMTEMEYNKLKNNDSDT